MSASPVPPAKNLTNRARPPTCNLRFASKATLMRTRVSALRMLEILDHIRSDISKLDRKAVFALVYAAFGLTCIYYLKDQGAVAKVLTGTRFEGF